MQTNNNAEFIAVFFTHSGAIKYNKFLDSLNVNNEMLPVPRKLSSNCGIGVRFSFDGDISKVVTEDIEKLFKIIGKEYKAIYESN